MPRRIKGRDRGERALISPRAVLAPAEKANNLTDDLHGPPGRAFTRRAIIQKSLVEPVEPVERRGLATGRQRAIRGIPTASTLSVREARATCVERREETETTTTATFFSFKAFSGIPRASPGATGALGFGARLFIAS